MNMSLADLMGEIDAAVYVIDCLPNMTAAMVIERTQSFVKRLRDRRPNVPIVLVESIEPRNTWFLPRIANDVTTKNRALRMEYLRLQAQGAKHVSYVHGDRLLGPDSESCVDGIHPTDLGFVYYANALEPFVRRALRVAPRETCCR
jgi:hypothetical protein